MSIALTQRVIELEEQVRLLLQRVAALDDAVRSMNPPSFLTPNPGEPSNATQAGNKPRKAN